MISSTFLNGFFLGLSLILAIGAQNSFVIRQGLARNHIVLTVLFCSLSDVFLIFLGISGIGLIAETFFYSFQQWIFILAAAWLSWYGLSHVRNAFNSLNQQIQEFKPETLSILQTLNKLFILTFLNPHVYLDTVLLIGIVSLQYEKIDVWIFGCGASLASIVFFCLLGFSASVVSSFFNSRLAWIILDGLIAGIMFSISFRLVFQSGIL